MILFQNRQKTGTLNVARVGVLCMATTMVLGFSNPEKRPEFEAEKEVLKGTEPIALVQTATLPRPVVKPVLIPANRPSSYAQSGGLDTVLGKVNSRQWSKPSMYSPDRAVADLRSSATSFHGVGFPQIRIHKRSAQHGHTASSSIGTWSRMISWRTAQDKVALSGPIAHVRCMGLSPQAVARRADKYEHLILSLGIEYEVSASLIKAVITEESCFNNKALSPAGAQGLMQLMPATATWLKVQDPHDPEDNMRAGVKYLAALRQQFDSLELVLAAYNAGPGNVRKYDGVPPFAETQAYVLKVQAHYRRYVAATRFATR